MSRERLEEIKERFENIQGDLMRDEFNWLIEQAEVAEVLSKKSVELNRFLQGVSSPKNLGRNVVDVAMDTIRVQAERVQELEDFIYQDARQAVLEGLYEENERYREVIKVIEKYANDCIDVGVEMSPHLVIDDIKTLEESK